MEAQISLATFIRFVCNGYENDCILPNYKVISFFLNICLIRISRYFTLRYLSLIRNQLIQKAACPRVLHGPLISQNGSASFGRQALCAFIRKSSIVCQLWNKSFQYLRITKFRILNTFLHILNLKILLFVRQRRIRYSLKNFSCFVQNLLPKLRHPCYSY